MKHNVWLLLTCAWCLSLPTQALSTYSNDTIPTPPDETHWQANRQFHLPAQPGKTLEHVFSTNNQQVFLHIDLLPEKICNRISMPNQPSIHINFTPIDDHTFLITEQQFFDNNNKVRNTFRSVTRKGSDMVRTHLPACYQQFLQSALKGDKSDTTTAQLQQAFVTLMTSSNHTLLCEAERQLIWLLSHPTTEMNTLGSEATTQLFMNTQVSTSHTPPMHNNHSATKHINLGPLKLKVTHDGEETNYCFENENEDAEPAHRKTSCTWKRKMKFIRPALGWLHTFDVPSEMKMARKRSFDLHVDLVKSVWKHRREALTLGFGYRFASMGKRNLGTHFVRNEDFRVGLAPTEEYYTYKNSNLLQHSNYLKLGYEHRWGKHWYTSIQVMEHFNWRTKIRNKAKYNSTTRIEKIKNIHSNRFSTEIMGQVKYRKLGWYVSYTPTQLLRGGENGSFLHNLDFGVAYDF